MTNDTLKYYISGGISGLIEISFIHPIEYFKTIIQYNNKKINFKNFIKTTYSENGIRSLYKGFLPRVIGIVPMRVIFWGSMYSSENYLSTTSIDKKYIYPLSGLIAGGAQTLIDCPMESLKTKMMTSNACISNSINFNGFVPNIIRNAGFAVIFNHQKNIMKQNYFDKGKQINFIDNFYIGCTSAIGATVITQPFDYIKSKMQEKLEKKVPMRIVIYNTFKHNPLLFFKGTLPRVSIVCISMAIGLPVFELVNNSLF